MIATPRHTDITAGLAAAGWAVARLQTLDCTVVGVLIQPSAFDAPAIDIRAATPALLDWLDHQRARQGLAAGGDAIAGRSWAVIDGCRVYWPMAAAAARVPA